ncbi:MAG: S49 family peptidase [Alphaproteobacteria bacterium]|nr:MAG: S49 family peptidase [Alphaproteobacteria bacterium]
MLARLPIPAKLRRPLVPVVRLQGVIASGGRMGPVLNDAALAPLLERAFRRGRPAAVALAINSPGGSPVQSSLIAARIRRLADETGVPALAFVEDVAASGGYWIAAAADEIFVDAGSIIGSIGVIHASFGLHEFIGRHGIERRIHTAGENKSFLDPFLPERSRDVARLEALQRELHELFIDHVRARRGEKLADDPELFTGAFWLGRRGVELGLADEVGHLEAVLRERFGPRVRTVPLRQRRPWWQRFGASAAEGALGRIEERLMAERYGIAW